MLTGGGVVWGERKILNLGFSDLRAEDEEFSSRLVKFYLA
uniref:Uncharacterized protein n=1 Tax=Salmonella typhimurium TaxID=90371 RepID=A0A385JK56_SALTM|nr:hypothetical protein MH257753_0090 [Salmonella enterica subsp. enterica serovar Typhimurium]AXY98879.1 hypothetical protein pST1007-1B_LOC0090 [Salmonella enterica subsp. enterica serovar Typhimurium]AXY99030.1 hypothetical protein pST1007-1C_LOC0090 [Salmonella enterica subsp. enterica serovar Typhimurium]AXY99177.1 hypothetical protein pST1007-1D0090 [Salmonella enterica subsp. enterica serovar Typhimurium]